MSFHAFCELVFTDGKVALFFFPDECRIVLDWQVEGKRTTHACFTMQLDRTTEKVRQTTADRETETCTTVFAGCGTFSLLEGFEDDILFVFGDTDTCIPDLEGN